MQDSRLIYQLLDENDYSEDIVIGILLQIQPSPNASGMFDTVYQYVGGLE